jgi:hypothetical protein
VINASALQNGQLKFRRWLNAASTASINVVSSTGQIFNVWSSSGVSDSAWSLQTIDIGQFANGNSRLQVTFRQSGGTSGVTRSGWNIDRFMVRDGSKPDFDVCGGCGLAPAFTGAAWAADANACADTGVTVSWAAAPAWGTGRQGTYTLYRSTDSAFVPSAANLVAKGIAATAYTDATAPNDANLYYIVRAENDETCSSGPQNGGMIDSNVVRVSGRDETVQPVPADTQSVRLTPIDDAHIRLSWAAVVNAASYHVYQAHGPQGPFSRIGTTTGTLYDDLNQMGNANTWYYLVKPANACGTEAP